MMFGAGKIIRAWPLFFHRTPSTQWWTQLATSIAGGLAFATLLTLVLPPCLLVLVRKQH